MQITCHGLSRVNAPAMKHVAGILTLLNVLLSVFLGEDRRKRLGNVLYSLGKVTKTISLGSNGLLKLTGCVETAISVHAIAEEASTSCIERP